jgi:hypothetical protein
MRLPRSTMVDHLQLTLLIQASNSNSRDFHTSLPHANHNRLTILSNSILKSTNRQTQFRQAQS